ncbi:MAG TPA: pyridoxamine 5'-phosphate oxidase family protein [Blastocatellia bacterium]|nr:pyridoxamine 5'-phosphate oxidase family protein [Blastocatellia bacterium]
MLKQLSTDETRTILIEGRIGRLGCVTARGPYVIPIGYLFEDDCIYIHSTPGRKIWAMRADPRVCLQVDKVIDEYHWRSAIAFGQYEEITSDDERGQVLGKLLARFPHLTPAESIPKGETHQPQVIVFRIRIIEMTGMSEE